VIESGLLLSISTVFIFFLFIAIFAIFIYNEYKRNQFLKELSEQVTGSKNENRNQ